MKENSTYIIELKKKRNELNYYLYNKVNDAKTREKLLDQLKWLTHQIDYYSNHKDMQPLQDEYNWVVSNFNHDLYLKQDDKFPYLK
ncbi:MAG: hypothetical protein HY860_00280 [Chlamydiales bacterium]|nr:hypothetical protein [Chlamydiales bacterium]